MSQTEEVEDVSRARRTAVAMSRPCRSGVLPLPAGCIVVGGSGSAAAAAAVSVAGADAGVGSTHAASLPGAGDARPEDGADGAAAAGDPAGPGTGPAGPAYPANRLSTPGGAASGSAVCAGLRGGVSVPEMPDPALYPGCLSGKDMSSVFRSASATDEQSQELTNTALYFFLVCRATSARTSVNPNASASKP